MSDTINIILIFGVYTVVWEIVRYFGLKLGKPLAQWINNLLWRDATPEERKEWMGHFDD